MDKKLTNLKMIIKDEAWYDAFDNSMLTALLGFITDPTQQRIISNLIRKRKLNKIYEKKHDYTEEFYQ